MYRILSKSKDISIIKIVIPQGRPGGYLIKLISSGEVDQKRLWVKKIVVNAILINWNLIFLLMYEGMDEGV